MVHPIAARTPARPRLLPRLLGLSGGDELSAVLANLRLLFNTRAGDSAAVPDYGVPDLADLLHQFPAVSPALQRSLRAAISRHEPRLRGVQILAGSDHTLEIHAVLHGAPVRLRAALHANGRIDLR